MSQPQQDVSATGAGKATEPEPTVRLTEQEACTNLRAVLELCAAGRLKCSAKTSRPSAATVQVVDEHLVRGDFYADEAIAAFAWPLLLQAGGLARLEGTTLRLTPKGRKALDQPAHEVIRGLWQRWLTHGVIDEFSRVEEIKGQRSANALSAVKPRRQTVGLALAGRRPSEWIAVDDLFREMRRRGLSPTIERNERALWKLYLSEPQYGSLGYAGSHDWSLLQGRYTLAVLCEYAATLGLLDLTYVDPEWARDDYRTLWGADDLRALSRYDGIQEIRLNALGAYAAGSADSYEPPVAGPASAGALKVLPNLDVVATGEVDHAEVLLLGSFAEQTSDRVWTVSADSLLGALGSGRQLTELTDFLDQRSEHDLPGTLHTLVADVGRRSTAITDLGHVRVIECADPALAALIVHDRALRATCWLIGDKHIGIDPDQEQKFRAALRRLGYVIPNHSRRGAAPI